MAKKVSDSQVAGIKAHAKAKNKETIDKVSKASAVSPCHCQRCSIPHHLVYLPSEPPPINVL